MKDDSWSQRVWQSDLRLNHPKFKEKIERAYKESLEGKVTDLDELIAETKKDLTKRALK